MSSEDTAFQMDVLAKYDNLLVIGAVLFSTYAASYNRRFQYSKVAIKSICVAALCTFFGAQLSESNIDTDIKAVEHRKLSVKPPDNLT